MTLSFLVNLIVHDISAPRGVANTPTVHVPRHGRRYRPSTTRLCSAAFPSAVESLYLHPLEQLAGLSLLMGSTAILGPVSTTAFLLIVFVHTTANILVHTNMVFPHPACKLANYWAQRHDVHHGKHLNRNYASIFPFWDMMFDTYA